MLYLFANIDLGVDAEVQTVEAFSESHDVKSVVNCDDPTSQSKDLEHLCPVYSDTTEVMVIPDSQQPNNVMPLCPQSPIICTHPDHSGISHKPVESPFSSQPTSPSSTTSM